MQGNLVGTYITKKLRDTEFCETGAYGAYLVRRGMGT